MTKNPIWLGIDPGLAIVGWAILEEHLFDLKQLPIDDSVDAIGIGYAGLCGLRNEIK